MNRIAALLLAALLATSCYKGNPPCRPGTVDYPRCEDVTQPQGPRMGASLLYPGAPLLNSGANSGRGQTPILIEGRSLSAVTSYTTPSFTAGRFKRLQVFIRSDAASTFTGGVYSLTGVSGAYKKQTLYGLGGAAAAIVTAANWNNDDITGAPAVMDGWIDIRTGGVRNGFLNIRHENGGTPVLRIVWISNDDTTNAVTAFAMTFTGGTFTGYAEVWGVP